ncbi:hypothetical protein OHC33_011034 [Knufia fluminis]|uniref:CHAT domain-containing protein n=1 Tax=Knufia fluminis TaxID=191047 RepID=A0AAN8I247_9EURO|nr:hypothetical protein OHC33_011034 [Knufia fluminis]
MEQAWQGHPQDGIVGWAADTPYEEDANNVVANMLHCIPDISTEPSAVREQVAQLDRTIQSRKERGPEHSSDWPLALDVEASINLGHAILERYSITASQDDFREAIHRFRSARQTSGQADEKATIASLGVARCYCQRYQHFGSYKDRILAQKEFSRLYTYDHASAALPYLGLLTAWEAEYQPRINEIEKWLNTITARLAMDTDDAREPSVAAEPHLMTTVNGHPASSLFPQETAGIDSMSMKASKIRDIGRRIRNLKLWRRSSLPVQQRADQVLQQPRPDIEPTSSMSLLQGDHSLPTNAGPVQPATIEGSGAPMRHNLDSTLSPDLVLYLEAQGRLLLHRSRLVGLYDDLNEAISTFSRCLRLLSERRELHWRFRKLLAEAYLRKFEFSEDDALFQEAIFHINQALSNTCLSRREKLSCLVDRAELLFIGSSYYPESRTIFLAQSREDADSALDTMLTMASPLKSRLELLLTRLLGLQRDSPGTEWQINRLEMLHNAFWSVNISIDFDFQSPYCQSHIIGLLGHKIFQEAARSRDLRQLDKAITLLRRALQTVTCEVMNFYPTLYWERLGALLYALLRRIDAVPKGEDYNELSQLAHQYLQYPAPLARQLKKEFLTTLSRVLEALPEACGMDDIERHSIGIDFLVQKVAFETKHAQVQSYYRGTLARMYKMRGKAHDPRAFYSAIQPEVSIHKDQIMRDLRAAEELYRENTEYWAKYGSTWPHATLGLSEVLFSMYELTQDCEAGKEALHLAYVYLREDSADTVGTMEAAERVADLEIALNAAWERATQFYDMVVDVFRGLVTEGHLIAEKRRFLMEWSRMPIIATTSAVTAQRPLVKVFERLETTRSLFWDRHFNQLEDLERLKRENPSLHQELMECKNLILKHLKTSSESLGPGVAYCGHIYDNIVRRIQNETGFENFMKWSISEEDLKRYCAEGPVIAFVHSNTQSYSIVTTAQGVSRVALDQFNELDCARKYQEYLEVVRLAERGSDEARRKLITLLKWLWEVAAKPVLSSLDLIPSTKKSMGLPRIWWVTGGWISAFPIHAAGDYELAVCDNKPCSVMDCVVSAYTPTLRALLRSRDWNSDKSSQGGEVRQEALLISVPNAGSLPPLHFARKEVEEIGKVLRPHCKLRSYIEPQAKTQEAINGLKSCTVAHFACHAEAAENPLESQLHLADSFRTPLRVARLMKMEIRNCQLAYLSVCESALNRQWRLRDESLHLAAALQMAGIPSVVGTWWKIMDDKATEMARTFYKNLVKGQVGIVAGQGNAARALHDAVVKTRNEGVDPFIWGAYAYFGC